MLSRRIKCHACGTRSSYSTTSGTRQFCCDVCQAWNFLDKNGDYTDPPQTHVQQASERTIARGSYHNQQQQEQIFCSACLRNQQIYNESLANYLPDESHPQYAKYEKELPTYKQKLEERYPQICKTCAPKAQAIIHDADYYSMAGNARRLMSNSRNARRSASPAPLQSRDDHTKLALRAFLNVCGLLDLLSALYQISWHTYAIMAIHLPSTEYDVAPVKVSQCLEKASRSVFSVACAQEIASEMPKALIVATCLLWYNSSLKKLYDPNTRYSKIAGKRQHFAIALIALTVRTVAYLTLTSTSVAQMNSQKLAIHAFTLSTIVLSRFLLTSSTTARKWKVNGSIMPRPEDRDILGRIAGPAHAKLTPYASPTAPSVLLQDERERRFPIEGLAQAQQAHRRARPSMHLPPSPPGSDDGDPMEIETEPLVAQARSPFGARNSGWENMRTNILSMDDELRARQESQRTSGLPPAWLRSNNDPNPFRGSLPPAPSSQAKRLRNPVSQMPRFKDIPSTQRQDFLGGMREGIDKGRGFEARAMSVETEASDVTTDARSRTRGQLELERSSNWHLPSDAASATGLEDIFGGSSFNIRDLDDTQGPAQPEILRSTQPSPLWLVSALLGASILSLICGFLLDIGGVRRPICLWLVHGLEAFGY